MVRDRPQERLNHKQRCIEGAGQAQLPDIVRIKRSLPDSKQRALPATPSAKQERRRRTRRRCGVAELYSSWSGPRGHQPTRDSAGHERARCDHRRALAVVLHSVRFVAPRPAETAAVFDAGPTGLRTVACLRLAGASRVWAIEPVAARRELALQAGADAALDPPPSIPRARSCATPAAAAWT